MSNLKGRNIRHKIEGYLPRLVRQYLKRLYKYILRIHNICFHLKKGRLVEIRYRFRFSRHKPYCGFLGDRTIIEEFNVWNAKSGEIVVGKDCWFGIHNIVMGPIVIGDNFSSGPNVSLLGPRHAYLEKKERKREKTIIGKNVWISTGSIVIFGVNIGDNAVVGPGSVVTKDVLPNGLVSGNPARDLTKIVRFSEKRM